MERTVALKKLEKLLGKKLGWRINSKAPSPEDRQAARLALTSAIEERNNLKTRREVRYQEILAADAEYQTLKTAHKAASEKADQLSSMTRHFKITVGTSEGIFFLVKAEGDSWEEVIDKLAKEKVSA